MDSATPFQPWATDDSAKDVKTEREIADDAKLHRENVNPKHTPTASYDKGSVSTPSLVPGTSGSVGPGAEPTRDTESKMDSAKVASMQQIVESTLSQEGRQRVVQLLEAVEALSGAERLLLYLRLPTGVPPHDPLKQPVNPLGSRAELQQTVTWIQTHLEVDPDVSLPKQDVYDEYIAHCMSNNMKALSTADFGKVMKQVYPTVRPRRLGTRGNSRYCYSGLRKKIKLEVPQLPDLGESSKELNVASRESERIVCDWAETKLGVQFASLSELSRHLSGAGRAPLVAPPGPGSGSPPPAPAPATISLHHAVIHGDEASSRQLMKQLKRKIQTQGTPGRPKKNKAPELSGESPPSTSYTSTPHLTPVKHEEMVSEASYGYQPAYMPVYEPRAPYPYGVPPRAHSPHPPPLQPAPLPPQHPPLPVHDYRPDPYVFEPPYVPKDLSLPTARNLPINLSSDASLDLSTERTEWQRRRPPEPPPQPARLSLPGKKLILETYQSETQAGSRTPHPHVQEEFPRTEYLPKKMRAAEILGGKLAAARHALHGAPPPGPAPSSSTSTSTPAARDLASRSDAAFLDDPKNLTNRSKSTAAALAREEQEAASPTRSVKAPTPKSGSRAVAAGDSPDRAGSPDCCGLDGINIKTGMICEEKHSEILNRERVISICNIDKHDLDDYLNEGNSQEHEEELIKYFHQQRLAESGNAAQANSAASNFLGPGPDPHDDHSQGKNEKLSQLRELLAKNLKNSSGSNPQHLPQTQDTQLPLDVHEHQLMKSVNEGAFKPVVAANACDLLNGQGVSNRNDLNPNKHSNSVSHENGTSFQYANQNSSHPLPAANAVERHLYNGNSHNEPQSPTTRTQQYDFVPISEGCHSPGSFHCKSPLAFGARGQSPSKVNKPVMMGGSLQTSPISHNHSTAASPFVSPRNTPVPRSRLCSRPIPKHNGRKRRNPLSLGVADPNSKQFAIPNEQKIFPKTSMCGPGLKYCQPMSAPPSPNIITSQYKSQVFQCATGIPNGTNNMGMNLLSNAPFRENMNGDLSHPLSADPLSSEVSQFFQESLGTYRPDQDTSFRSQSVPLKQCMNMGLLSYANTPVGSVPPTPIPNEFCDFGSLGDTCDISKAGLNPETLDKIYDAIDSSNDVLNTGSSQTLLNNSDSLNNGCEQLAEQPLLTDEQLGPFIPSERELLDRSSQFSQSYSNDNTATDDVEDFLKRTSSVEFDLSVLVTEKNKYHINNTSRSVPNTPLPYKRIMPSLQIDPQRSRELYATENYSSVSNGMSSKSVPSTPQLVEERNVFSYSNRDFLINGNSVECGTQLQGAVVDSEQALASPLHDMLREDILDPLTPAADLLADLDKMDGTPYVDL